MRDCKRVYPVAWTCVGTLHRQQARSRSGPSVWPQRAPQRAGELAQSLRQDAGDLERGLPPQSRQQDAGDLEGGCPVSTAECWRSEAGTVRGWRVSQEGARQQQVDGQQALEGCSLLINSRSRVCSEERSQQVAGVINR